MYGTANKCLFILAMIMSMTVIALSTSSSKARHGTHWNRIGKRFESIPIETDTSVYDYYGADDETNGDAGLRKVETKSAPVVPFSSWLKYLKLSHNNNERPTELSISYNHKLKPLIEQDLLNLYGTNNHKKLKRNANRMLLYVLQSMKKHQRANDVDRYDNTQSSLEDESDEQNANNSPAFSSQ